MKYFIVELHLQLGEIIKQSYHVMESTDEQEASVQALIDEGGVLNEDDGEYWDDYQYIYQVNWCKEITKSEADTYNRIQDPAQSSEHVYTLLEMAEQQLLGYSSYLHGSIVDLVEAMGLTEVEFNKIIEDYPATITDHDIRELRGYFASQKESVRVPLVIEKCTTYGDTIVRVHNLQHWLSMVDRKDLVLSDIVGDGCKQVTSDGVQLGIWEDCGLDIEGMGYFASDFKVYEQWGDHNGDETWVKLSPAQVQDLKFLSPDFRNAVGVENDE